MNTLKYFLYTLAILIFLIAAKPARAFEISPVKSLFTVDPATSLTVVVKIKNTEKNNLVFKLNVFGMSQDEKGGPVFSRGIDAAESWVYPENNLVNIKSGEIKSVNFIIKIPADALAGSHYLGLAVEPVLSGQGNQSSLSARLVSLLTLQVKGMVEESVAIEKWELNNESPSLAAVRSDMNYLAKDNSKLKFDLSLKNSGTMEVLLRGAIAVRNWKGEELFSEPIILGNKLLAGSRRVLQPEIVLKNGVNLPGLYQAQVKINYGRTNQVVSAIAYIWYFPQWSKVASALLSIILLAVVILVVKHRK